MSDFMGMKAWVEARFGKSRDEVTIDDVQRELPHRPDLQDAPFYDSRGGRVRFRLQPWPTKDEASDLEARAERYRSRIPSGPTAK